MSGITPLPRTNGDTIRGLSNRALAFWLWQVQNMKHGPEDWYEWLRKPAEEKHEQ